MANPEGTDTEGIPACDLYLLEKGFTPQELREMNSRLVKQMLDEAAAVEQERQAFANKEGYPFE